MTTELNDLQQAIIDALAELGAQDAVHTAVSSASILERIQHVPGMDDVTSHSVGPCIRRLANRGLVRSMKHSSVPFYYLTQPGMDAVSREDGGDTSEQGEERHEPSKVESAPLPKRTTARLTEAQMRQHLPDTPSAPASTVEYQPRQRGAISVPAFAGQVNRCDELQDDLMALLEGLAVRTAEALGAGENPELLAFGDQVARLRRDLQASAIVQGEA